LVSDVGREKFVIRFPDHWGGGIESEPFPNAGTDSESPALSVFDEAFETGKSVEEGDKAEGVALGFEKRREDIRAFGGERRHGRISPRNGWASQYINLRIP